MRKGIFIIFFASNIFSLQAQENDSMNGNVRIDTFNNATDILTDTTLYLHTITLSPDTITSWKGNEKYAYIKDLDSLLKASQQQMYSRSSGNTISLFQKIFSSGLVTFFLWVIAAGVIGFILYRLFVVQGIFQKRSSSLPVNEIPYVQDFDDSTDFNALIKSAVATGEYRLGIRYMFLKTLARLFEKGLLERSSYKTNYQYAQELTADKKRGFATLVLSYEYIWYGNLVINATKFEELENLYAIFYNKI